MIENLSSGRKTLFIMKLFRNVRKLMWKLYLLFVDSRVSTNNVFRQLHYIAKRSQDKIFRGKEQRNEALDLIRLLVTKKDMSQKAVLYFADDDNSYDSAFLDSLRYTRKISMFNVGLIANKTHEGPIVENNKVSQIFVLSQYFSVENYIHGRLDSRIRNHFLQQEEILH